MQSAPPAIEAVPGVPSGDPDRLGGTLGPGGQMRPSLLDRVLSAVRRPPARLQDGQWRRTMLILAGEAAAGLVGVAAVAGWQTRAARAEIVAGTDEVAAAERRRDRLEAIAGVLAAPPAGARMATVQAHLPPDVQLAGLSLDADGTLTLLIDVADPDVLRASLAADPALAGLRERGQEARSDGRIRVRLTGGRAP